MGLSSLGQDTEDGDGEAARASRWCMAKCPESTKNIARRHGRWKRSQDGHGDTGHTHGDTPRPCLVSGVTPPHEQS